jgi:hypothetical protein
MIIIDDFHHVNFIFSQNFHFFILMIIFNDETKQGVCVTLTMALAIYIKNYLQ